MGSLAPLSHPADHPDLTDKEAKTIRQIYEWVEVFFQNPKFDSSHDFEHVKRVVKNALFIVEKEKAKLSLSTFTVIAGALLHDVEDKKYVSSTEAAPIKTFLLNCGISDDEAVSLQLLVEGVSWSSEMKDPQRVEQLIKEIPELAAVQDADRLDAIGAIGIGRAFAFGTAKGNRGLDQTIKHIYPDKLYKLERTMKTETGRILAAERTRRLHEFVTWWQEEHSI